ncbi:hypothetical protein [Zunongwangia endophytica]|uniref:Lipoprotein n=1 Tax=Zunongwangia endophytica TaxID=1808945 RepID=A0ABV8HC17_9FLAO|nr:hypothetical protein [Zunongwangia endophytica]MDN3594154.1 hypothetical protein [Zunongwangia endophytica]
MKTIFCLILVLTLFGCIHDAQNEDNCKPENFSSFYEVCRTIALLELSPLQYNIIEGENLVFTCARMWA